MADTNVVTASDVVAVAPVRNASVTLDVFLPAYIGAAKEGLTASELRARLNMEEGTYNVRLSNIRKQIKERKGAMGQLIAEFEKVGRTFVLPELKSARGAVRNSGVLSAFVANMLAELDADTKSEVANANPPLDGETVVVE